MDHRLGQRVVDGEDHRGVPAGRIARLVVLRGQLGSPTRTARSASFPTPGRCSRPRPPAPGFHSSAVLSITLSVARRPIVGVTRRICKTQGRAAQGARKKAPGKGRVPGGQRTLYSFPGAIGRSRLWRRCWLSGTAMLSRFVNRSVPAGFHAGGQSLRGPQATPTKACPDADPSTW